MKTILRRTVTSLVLGILWATLPSESVANAEDSSLMDLPDGTRYARTEGAIRFHLTSCSLSESQLAHASYLSERAATVLTVQYGMTPVEVDREIRNGSEAAAKREQDGDGRSGCPEVEGLCLLQFLSERDSAISAFIGSGSEEQPSDWPSGVKDCESEGERQDSEETEPSTG